MVSRTLSAGIRHITFSRPTFTGRVSDVQLLRTELVRSLHAQRFYTQGTPHDPINKPVAKSVQAHKESQHESTRPQPKHEAHEKSLYINVPFNPPGGGGGAGPGGSGGSFSITNSPLMDAALTTFIGLGLGESIRRHVICLNVKRW